MDWLPRRRLRRVLGKLPPTRRRGCHRGMIGLLTPPPLHTDAQTLYRAGMTVPHAPQTSGSGRAEREDGEGRVLTVTPRPALPDGVQRAASVLMPDTSGLLLKLYPHEGEWCRRRDEAEYLLAAFARTYSVRGAGPHHLLEAGNWAQTLRDTAAGQRDTRQNCCHASAAAP